MEVAPPFTSAAMLKDINGGPGASSNAYDFTDAGGTLFFTAEETPGDTELWKSNGTEAGTLKVGEINAGGSANVGKLVAFGNRVIFRADNGTNGGEPWISDGGPIGSGTNMIEDIRTTPVVASGSSQTNMSNIGGTAIFRASDGVGGDELWRIPPPYTDASLIQDLNPGGGISMNDGYLVELGGSAYAGMDTGLLASLWRTDSPFTSATQIGPAGLDPDDMIRVGSTLLFSGFDLATGEELWRSRGTTATTSLVKDHTPGPGDTPITSLTRINETTAFFVAEDGDGREPWKVVIEPDAPTVDPPVDQSTPPKAQQKCKKKKKKKKKKGKSAAAAKKKKQCKKRKKR